MLLEHGANPNAQLKKLPPYRAKLDRGNDTMLGAGTTPFLRAAKAGDVPAMRLLLEHGADPTLSPTRSGITPLMAAAGLGTAEQDTTGRYKTQAQAIEAIQLLLDRGADVNAAANDGRTALHGAALQGYDDVIKFLAAHGADSDREGPQGLYAARHRARSRRRLRFHRSRRGRARRHGGADTLADGRECDAFRGRPSGSHRELRLRRNTNGRARTRRIALQLPGPTPIVSTRAVDLAALVRCPATRAHIEEARLDSEAT